VFSFILAVYVCRRLAALCDDDVAHSRQLSHSVVSHSTDTDRALVFIVTISVLWIGGFIVSLNAILLGGHMYAGQPSKAL
jgi:hypothetical protein